MSDDDKPGAHPLDEHGHWEGDTFVFNEPLRYEVAGSPTPIVRSIDCSHMVLPAGVSREDVVHALLNPYHVETGPDVTTVDVGVYDDADTDPVWEDFERRAGG